MTTLIESATAAGTAGLERLQTAAENPIVREYGLTDYVRVWKRMARFAATAGPETREEIWLLRHKPVFTLGQTGTRKHVLSPGDIPIIQTDRGGQVTYHGPGQWVIYPLLDLRRRRMGIRDLVDLIETAVIAALAEAGIAAAIRPGAPGVYVDDAKIAALGLRIRRGWSYHGLSLNVDMNLSPFRAINPCGYRGLKVVQVADLIGRRSGLMKYMGNLLIESILLQLERYPAGVARLAGEAVHV